MSDKSGRTRTDPIGATHDSVAEPADAKSTTDDSIPSKGAPQRASAGDAPRRDADQPATKEAKGADAPSVDDAAPKEAAARSVESEREAAERVVAESDSPAVVDTKEEPPPSQPDADPARTDAPTDSSDEVYQKPDPDPDGEPTDADVPSESPDPDALDVETTADEVGGSGPPLGWTAEWTMEDGPPAPHPGGFENVRYPDTEEGRAAALADGQQYRQYQENLAEWDAYVAGEPYAPPADVTQHQANDEDGEIVEGETGELDGDPPPAADEPTDSEVPADLPDPDAFDIEATEEDAADVPGGEPPRGWTDQWTVEDGPPAPHSGGFENVMYPDTEAGRAAALAQGQQYHQYQENLAVWEAYAEENALDPLTGDPLPDPADDQIDDAPEETVADDINDEEAASGATADDVEDPSAPAVEEERGRESTEPQPDAGDANQGPDPADDEVRFGAGAAATTQPDDVGFKDSDAIDSDAAMSIGSAEEPPPDLFDPFADGLQDDGLSESLAADPDPVLDDTKSDPDDDLFDL